MNTTGERLGRSGTHGKTVRAEPSAPNGTARARPRRFALSLVVPMYNESESCGIFFDRVIPVLRNLTDDFEIVCVNGGSRDDTLQVLMGFHARDPCIKIVDLSRNFGKEVALTAGIEHATGDAVIPIDADLQDPPELIPDLVERWLEGYDSVIAIRADRRADGYLKRTTATWFYRIIGSLSEVSIPANAGDFRLMDRAVVEALKKLPERNRFMKGLYAWVGFSQTMVEYVSEKRAAGTTKWSVWRLWSLALDGVFSFSTFPLRIWTYLGLGVATCSAAYGLYIVLRTLTHGVDEPGYASIITTVLFLSGMNMIGIGILGEYVGRLFMEAKQRPLYLVNATVGLGAGGADGGTAAAGRRTSRAARTSMARRRSRQARAEP